MLILPLLLLGPIVQDVPPTPLTERVGEAERIVVAKLERIHEVTRAGQAPAVRVAELSVESVLLGEPSLERVFVSFEPSPPPLPNARALWYLTDHEPLRGESRSFQARLGKIVGTTPVHAIVVHDAAEKTPAELAKIRRAALRTVPRIEARYTSTGIRNWSVVIDAQGMVTFPSSGRPVRKLEKERLASLHGPIPELLALPAKIGTSLAPEAVIRTLRLVTAAGVRRIETSGSAKVPEEHRTDFEALELFWERLSEIVTEYRRPR